MTIPISSVWRLSFGIGIIPPLFIFIFRLRMENPIRYQQSAIQTKTPYWLALKRYWRSFLGVSALKSLQAGKQG